MSIEGAYQVIEDIVIWQIILQNLIKKNRKKIIKKVKC